MNYSKEFLASKSIIELNKIFKDVKMTKNEIEKLKKIRRTEKNRMYAIRKRKRNIINKKNELEPYEYLIGYLYSKK